MHKNKTDVQVLNLPAGYFGMVLGTIGMGFSWRYASTIWPVSPHIGEVMVSVAIVMWALLAAAFLTRAVRFPYSVWQEMRHPIASSFVSLFPATTMLVAIGVTLQLSYAAWQTAGLWRGEHPADATTPGLYLPTVANNFISAMACGALGFSDAGLVFLGAGVVSWLTLEPAIVQRLRSGGTLSVPLRTSLGIQLAPALVACNAWLSVNGGHADVFAKMLFGYGLLQLIFMLRLMPWYLRQAFNASFWSFSFGISALASTGLHLGHASGPGFFHSVALPLFVFTNMVIGLLLLRTLLLLLQGKLLTRVAASTLMKPKDEQ